MRQDKEAAGGLVTRAAEAGFAVAREKITSRRRRMVWKKRIEEEMTMGELTVKEQARRLGNGELANQLKQLFGGMMTATLDGDGEQEEDPALVLVEEAAVRLSTIDMVQQLDGGMNLAYSDGQLAAMSDGELAGLLEGQSVSVLMDTGDPEAPLELNAHGNGCLERRLAKECARRLKEQAAKRHGEECLRAFAEGQTGRVEPFRPV